MIRCAHGLCERPAVALAVLQCGPFMDVDVLNVKVCEEHQQEIEQPGHPRQWQLRYTIDAKVLQEKRVEW
jgi:hypothetical protein